MAKDEEIEPKAKRTHSDMVARAAALLDSVSACDFTRWGTQGDAESMRVLNAVSPGFTCATPFAECVLDQMEEAAA